MEFPGDARKGQVAETFLVGLFKKAGIECQLNPSKKKAELAKWDVAADVQGRSFTVEAKHDMYEAKSGNIAIEYFNPKSCKPSGLFITEADLWAIVLSNPTTAWVANVKALKKFFNDAKCLRDVACGGDGNSAMKLYPREQILDAVFTRIDHLPAEELAPALTKLLE